MTSWHFKAWIAGEAWRKQSNGAIVGERKTFRYKTKPEPLGSESGHIYTSRSQRQVGGTIQSVTRGVEHADGRAKARFYVLKKRIQKKPSQEEKQSGARLVVEETDEAGCGAVGNLAAHSPAEGKRKASQLHVWENTQPLRRGALY